MHKGCNSHCGFVPFVAAGLPAPGICSRLGKARIAVTHKMILFVPTKSYKLSWLGLHRLETDRGWPDRKHPPQEESGSGHTCETYSPYGSDAIGAAATLLVHPEPSRGPSTGNHGTKPPATLNSPGHAGVKTQPSLRQPRCMCTSRLTTPPPCAHMPVSSKRAFKIRCSPTCHERPDDSQ